MADLTCQFVRPDRLLYEGPVASVILVTVSGELGVAQPDRAPGQDAPPPRAEQPRRRRVWPWLLVWWLTKL